MHHCPHCGAALREHARFCPACMTPLNEKRVIPTPKYVSLRWLSATGAVLVLAAALWGVEQGLYTDPPPVTDTIGTVSTTLTTAASTTLTTVASTTLTTAVESLSAASTTVTTVAYTNYLPVYPSTAATEVTSGRVPSFLTTAGTTRPTSTTRSTTKAPTTTTKTPTTTTTTTRPYWQDVTPASFTEDGLPIEEVTWTYEPITSSTLGFYRCKDTDYPHITGNSTSRTATPSGVPVNQCIKVTGCIGTTSNGIYRVPAMIDGKTVAVVDFGDTFADKSVALTVKRIYLPPDALRFQGGIENCTKLEGLYMTSPDFWLNPDDVPDCGTYSWGGVTYYNLTLHVPYDFNPIYIQYYSPYVWLYACKGNVYDAEAGMLTDQKCQALYGVAAA
ncbi:MAG: zinc ribbon domain-containing protein [Clostridia bacterium]|nr:zinc ribbon domain-containing protein [Clostridia bacterium]